jgi:hypothetical protein
VGNRLGFIGFIYALLFPLPLATLALSLSNMFSYEQITILICLIIIALYSFSTWSTVQHKS